MKSKLTQVTHKCKGSANREATIYFTMNNNGLEFDYCEYQCKTNKYNLEDWVFLGEISKEIKELQQIYRDAMEDA